MTKELPFNVPEELHPFIDEHVITTHEKYRNIGLETVRQAMGEQKMGTIALNIGGDPEAGIHVLALPHQQTWKPSMALRSYLYHDINNPNGVTIVLPNNSFGEASYRMSDSDRQKIESGDMQPFYEAQTKTIESVLSRYGRIGSVSLDGYSLGGLTALGIASVGSDHLAVQSVHSVESPNKETTPKKLQKDFMKSGGFGDQREAVADAAVPALTELHRVLPLGIDYARFGIASVTEADNKALAKGMATPKYAELVEKTLAHYNGVRIAAGHIAGSRLFDPEIVEYIDDPRFEVQFYNEGPGSHKHATGDNIMAHALMMKR